jgi:hypothetical protein
MSLIINAGVNPEYRKYLNDKIKISNQVAILLSITGLCYTVFSIIYYPQLTVYPAFCIFFSLGCIALNNLGLHVIARFTLSTLVLLLAYIYHGMLVQEGETIIPSMMVIEFSLSVIPWVLIDFREKKLLTITLTVCYVLIFSQTWANEVLYANVDSSMFRSGFLNVASCAFGILILVSCLTFMHSKNHFSEQENEKLLVDINKKNTEMEEQQLELEKNLKEIEKARVLEEKQNWVAKGIADISDLLRQHDGEDIYSTLLSATVKYLEANQGAIYLVNDEDADHIFLEMAACYAFERKKFFTKQIEIGQGLVGQCYLEKESILLKNAPEEFIIITSGLGESLPSFIAIIPIMQETKVVGVMEFALFREMEKYQVEFLEKLGQNIASFFLSNSMNLKTKALLEQSQIQMEQLRAQEEEMRQNMEELQATQEEMQRKEQEYLQRIAMLENEPA